MKWKLLFYLSFCVSTIFADGPEIHCVENPLLDEEIKIQVVGLKPKQVILIEASWIDGDRVQWTSEGVFQANSNGIVEIAKQAPLTGNYRGVDSMGLFWSMEMHHVVPVSEAETDPCSAYCFPNELRVFDGKKLIAKKTIYRCFKNEQVEKISVREKGLVGSLFLPSIEQPMPVVIVLTGANGGMQTETAALIASHGFPAFALAYSGLEDLPPSIQNVPLEYFETAFAWIENHPKLNGKIYLHGTSRGAELALILGSFFPEKIHKIVAVAPSSVVLSSNSWLYHNEPILPAAPYFIDLNNDSLSLEDSRENPRSIRIHRERGLVLDRERFDEAAIPVEGIECPILLITGGADQQGPCTTYANLILERLEKYDSKIARDHLDFPGAGHLISQPYLPRSNIYCSEGMWLNYGGTPKDDERASRESWKRTLEFFNE